LYLGLLLIYLNISSNLLLWYNAAVFKAVLNLSS
jgi:hypothetical protein